MIYVIVYHKLTT